MDSTFSVRDTAIIHDNDGKRCGVLFASGNACLFFPQSRMKMSERKNLESVLRAAGASRINYKSEKLPNESGTVLGPVWRDGAHTGR
jgi:hypothetical protein